MRNSCGIHAEDRRNTVSSRRLMSVSHREGSSRLVVDGAPEGALDISDVRVRFTNGMELSNNLSEQMMHRIKMNLKNACNIGCERSARHNTFM